MKRFLSTFFAFVFIAAISYSILMLLAGDRLSAKWKTNLNYNLPGNGYLYTRLKDADTTKPVDVLILGSSKAYMGYDVRIFKNHHLNAFNLGSPAQTFMQTEIIVKRYLDHFKPKLILIDVHPNLFMNAGLGSGLDLVSNCKFGADLLNMAAKLNDIKVYNTMLYSIYRQQFYLNNSYVETQREMFGKYIKGGFVQSNLHSAFKPPVSIKMAPIEVSEVQQQAFKRTIAFLKSRKIPYILLQSPVESTSYNAIQNRTQIDSIISKEGTYFNMNNYIKISHQEFLDDVHMNQQGVEKYNHYLLDFLKKKNYFTEIESSGFNNQ